jgi:hypothetical protein
MPIKPVSTVSLTDQELQQRSQCSMYISTEVDPWQGPADRTIRWAISERASGTIRKPDDLRVHFAAGWKKAWKGQAYSKAYWAGINKALPFGRRVYYFLLKYEVEHPFRPYTLKLDGGRVTGSYALVWWDKCRKGSIPMLVRPILRRPRFGKTPDYAVLAQWLAARREMDTVDLNIVHLPMFTGERWITKDVKAPLAKRWINDILIQAAEKMDFPRAGTQCATCSRPCNEVFDGPYGPDWHATDKV